MIDLAVIETLTRLGNEAQRLAWALERAFAELPEGSPKDAAERALLRARTATRILTDEAAQLARWEAAS